MLCSLSFNNKPHSVLPTDSVTLQSAVSSDRNVILTHRVRYETDVQESNDSKDTLVAAKLGITTISPQF